MNQATANALLIIASAGFLITLGTFGIAAYVSLKARRNFEEMKKKAEESKAEFKIFLTKLADSL